MMKREILPLILFLFLIGTGCIRKPAEPDPPPARGALQGSVKSGENAVFPSYIFIGEELAAEPDESGAFHVDMLEAGTYQVTGSALMFADTTVEVVIQGDQTTTLDLSLTPDTTTGFLIGEFQDDSLFLQQLGEKPEMAEWTDQEICDGATGATIQFKWLKPFEPFPHVLLGEDTLSADDGWGQYGFRIQCGTYPFTGICNGYQSVTGVARVEPGANTFLNFFLPRDN